MVTKRAEGYQKIKNESLAKVAVHNGFEEQLRETLKFNEQEFHKDFKACFYKYRRNKKLRIQDLSHFFPKNHE